MDKTAECLKDFSFKCISTTHSEVVMEVLVPSLTYRVELLPPALSFLRLSDPWSSAQPRCSP